MRFFLFILVVVVFINLISRFFRKQHSKAKVKVLNNIPSANKASFLLYTFSMLGALAAVDGEISTEEKERMQKYLEEELGLGGKLKRLALKAFLDAATSDLTLRDYALKYREAEKDRVLLFTETIKLLLSLSVADKFLSPKEDEAMRGVAILFGISEDTYTSLKEHLEIISPVIH